MGPFYANAGPLRGPLLLCDVTGPIAVLKAPDGAIRIGVALPVGQDGTGVALWWLTISGIELFGLWTVVDREFVPVP